MGAQKQADNGIIQRDRNNAHYATPPPLECVGYEKITVGATAVGFTLADGKLTTQADSVCLRVEGNDIRFRADGTDPTTDEGMLLKTTDVQPFWIVNATFEELVRYKFIRDTGSDGTLLVLFYRVQG